MCIIISNFKYQFHHILKLNLIVKFAEVTVTLLGHYVIVNTFRLVNI